MKKYMPLVGYLVSIALAVQIVMFVVNKKFQQLYAEHAAQPFIGMSVRDQQRQIACMAENIYFEAGAEPAEGKIAVAQVVMNRVAHPNFPKDPCAVIHQKSVMYERVVCQFSWLCMKEFQGRKKNPEWYKESYEAAVMVMMEGMRLPSLRDALYYHADYVDPKWGKTRVAHIGRHIFYKP